jgi:hypothetical protein
LSCHSYYYRDINVLFLSLFFLFFLSLGQRKKDHVRELFESRARAEDDAISARTPHNRLHVSSLVELLKERQDMALVVDDSAGSSSSSPTATATATKQLAGKYGLDVELLEKLARHVNVPPTRSGRETPLGGAGAGAGAGAGTGAGTGTGTGTGAGAESGDDIAVWEVSSFFV